MTTRSRKSTWYIRLCDTLSVEWTCLNRETRKPYILGEPWARFIVVRAQAEDGRPLDLVLTPKEAHALGRRLQMRAERVQEDNAQHKNGWADDADQSDIAVITSLKETS